MKKTKLETRPPMGVLDVGTSRKRVIAEWQLFREDARELKLPPLTKEQRTVQVVLSDEGKDTGLLFTATGGLLPAPLSNASLEALRHEVQAALRDQLALRTGLQWERWLKVTVRSEVEFGPAVSASTRVTYEVIWRAESSEGKVLTVHPSNHVVLPLEPAIDEDSPAPDNMEIDGRQFKADPNLKSRSYVPATPENIAAVEDIQRRLRELNQALASVLKQENAQPSLDAVKLGAPVAALGLTPPDPR